MSQKKRVRIYKAGGQKGQYINPTAKWMMQVGGQPQAQSEISDEQISAYVQNALMQDSDPNDIYKSLLQSGVDKNKANQIISSIVEYINEARKVEMSDKTGQPELAKKEAEEMAILERDAAEEDAQTARQMQMMQMAMEDTQADEEMFTNDAIDDYIEGNDEQMMYGGQPLPSKSKFVKQAMKEYKKGGAIGQGQKPDEASLNAATNFIQSVNKESNEAKIKQEAEQYYDNVMLPQARRGKEMRTQRMLNRGLNQILGGVSNAGMASPYMYSQANPYGAQLKTANIDVRKTGLFGRPKQYSVQFDWDYINQPQLVKDAIDLEISNAEDEVKNTQKQQVAKKNETTSANSRLKELAKKRASGEVKSSGTTKSSGTKKATVKTEPEVEVKSWDKNNNGIPDRVENEKRRETTVRESWEDELQKIMDEPIPRTYRPYDPNEFYQNPLNNPANWATGAAIGYGDKEDLIGLGAGIIAGGVLNRFLAPAISKAPGLGQGVKQGVKQQGRNQLTEAQKSAIRYGKSKNTAFSNYARETGFNAKPPAQYGPFKSGYGPSLQQGGMYNQFGGAVNPFNLDPTGLAKFIYGGSKDLTLYQTAGEKQEEFWTKHYKKPDTGEIINQETGAVVTLPDFTDDVTTQTGTSDYEKRIKELENQLAGFKSNTGVARDMYGRQLPPPLFNRRARDLAGAGSLFGIMGMLNPLEYVGSWNQYSDMYDPNTGERIPDEVRKRIGLPNLTEIDVRKSRLIGGRPKAYSLKFGMPGSASTSKEDLRENIAMDNNNSFSNIDSKGRLLREKEDTRYNKMSDKKWEKFKEKEEGKNIPEDYVSPETKINPSDLSSIQTNQKPIGVGNNILGKENLIMPEVPIESLPARPIVSSANQIQGIENLRNYMPSTNTETTTQPVLQQEISNLVNPSTSEDFSSWLSRNAMGPSIPPADMVNNPNIGLDLLAAEDYATRSLNEGFNEDYLNKFIKPFNSINDTLPPGYSIRESDGTLMIPDPFDYNSPGPRNPEVIKWIDWNTKPTGRQKAIIDIINLKKEVFPGSPNLRDVIKSMIKSYSEDNNIPEENFQKYKSLPPEEKIKLINRAKNNPDKKDLYEILIYLADAGSNSSSDDALGQAKKGGSLPRFQNNGQFNLVDTSAIEVDEDYLMGERPDYVQFYDDKEYMFSGKDDSFIGPAQVDVKEKDTYTFDPTKGLDLFNVGAYKVLNTMEKPDFTKFTGTNIYDSNMDVSDKGTYDIDSGLFRPGRMGFEGVVQKGGSINDELYMTEEEIEEFLRNGGQLEYL